MADVTELNRDTSRPGSAVRDVTYYSSDGLALFARDYGDRLQPWLPAICLPGLTRNHRDFDDLAVFLSCHRHRPRRVVCFDYRGRGRSAWDRNTGNYNPLQEMNDIFDGMAALGISRAVAVGTSRGGIVAMLMGVARPATLAGIVLNDIGPKIEPIGLARIKTYIGRTPAPDDWADAVRILKRLHGAQFTALSDSQWMDFARKTYREENGRPVSDHDPGLKRSFDGIDFDEPIPTMWREFRALRSMPILAIRGANSDLLSTSTLAAMAAEHPLFESITVPGEGHPPLLVGTHLPQRISSFITGIEGSGPPIEAVVPTLPPDFDSDNNKREAPKSPPK
jgi:pimeloyl-ACP methyl ester carboxylesterase